MMMIRQRGSRVLAFIALVVTVTAKPPPSVSPWAAMYGGKGAYARSLGPPVAPGLSTITVPFGPKSPFFPKFVDPKSLIAAKTDMLSNLFGGLGPVNYPGLVPTGFSKFGSPTPVLYATNDDEVSKVVSNPEFVDPEKTEETAVKRAAGFPFGMYGPKFGPASSPFGPYPPFGPFGSKFAGSSYASPSSKFGPYSPPNFSSSRKKRSLVAPAGASKDLGPPPAYPGLGTIAEESEADASATPKQYLPGMFGPFGPFGPFKPTGAGPLIDPSFFIAKKTSLLDSLFSNLATSTPATVANPPAVQNPFVPSGFYSPVESATEVPVPKTTIVPPGFWAPSSIIPSPTEYTDKVNFFLDKLFAKIVAKKLAAASNATASGAAASKNDFTRSIPSESETEKSVVARSVDDLQTISAAKDAIVDSIIAELGALKTDMIENLDDLIASEKMEAFKSIGKKPVKPFKAAFAGLWGPPPVDTTLPFKQKMSVLSQVFDMLTELQKNITVAVTGAIKSTANSDASAEEDYAQNISGGFYYPTAKPKDSFPFNVSFLDAIKSKLDSLETPSAFYQPSAGYEAGKFARDAFKGPSPFYLPPPEVETVKRDVDDFDYDYDHHEHDYDDRDQYKRAVKMSMHQGYQSMPPGTVETVQAGGGSTPDHQGGGINLLDEENYYGNDGNKYAEWGQYMKNQYKDQRHHHNHH